MTELVAIRPAAPDQVPAIVALVHRNLREVNVRDYGPAAAERLVAAFTAERVTARLAYTLVAILEARLVGTATLDGDRVRAVFVAPDGHGQGVGRALMAAIEQRAARNGVARLHLASSLTAVGFYQRLGYRGFGDHYYGDERTVLMEKSLDS